MKYCKIAFMAILFGLSLQISAQSLPNYINSSSELSAVMTHYPGDSPVHDLVRNNFNTLSNNRKIAIAVFDLVYESVGANAVQLSKIDSKVASLIVNGSEEGISTYLQNTQMRREDN